MLHQSKQPRLSKPLREWLTEKQETEQEQQAADEATAEAEKIRAMGVSLLQAKL